MKDRTAGQDTLVKDTFAKTESLLKADLLSKATAKIEPNSKQTKDQQIQELKKNIDANFSQVEEDLQRGLNLLMEKALPAEKTQVWESIQKMLQRQGKSNGQGEPHARGFEDAVLLDKIAKREMAAKQYENAKCMFRFIIQVDSQYSPAWVGVALCEQEKGLEAAEHIYKMGMDVLNNDYYIRLYAAKFYSGINQKAKAKEIVKKGIDDMQKSGNSHNQIYKDLSALLTEL